MEEKQNIGSLFNRIAGSYDRLNHLLSLNIDRRWRRKTVRELHPCTHVLDVAIGTADLTIEIMRQGKARQITGIDLSDGMMQIGQEKVDAVHTKLPLSATVTFLHANAQDMPFEDCTFDAVTSSYGVRNFSNLDQGLNEMYRILKPGGQLLILELSYPKNRFIAWCYDIYFSHILPVIGRIISRDKTAYTYLNRSVKHFIWGEEMCEHLRCAGFLDVQFRPLSFGISTIYSACK